MYALCCLYTFFFRVLSPYYMLLYTGLCYPAIRFKNGVPHPPEPSLQFRRQSSPFLIAPFLSSALNSLLAFANSLSNHSARIHHQHPLSHDSLMKRPFPFLLPGFGYPHTIMSTTANDPLDRDKGNPVFPLSNGGETMLFGLAGEVFFYKCLRCSTNRTIQVEPLEQP